MVRRLNDVALNQVASALPGTAVRSLAGNGIDDFIGDVVIAVNNVPITTERQLSKLLSGTAAELSVLVDRVVYEEDEDKSSPYSSFGTVGKDTVSQSEFEEIEVPKVFKGTRDGSLSKEMSKKGSRRRSHSATTFSHSVVLPFGAMSGAFTDQTLFGAYVDGKLCNSLSGIPLENSSFITRTRFRTEPASVLKDSIDIRRARSEAELTDDALCEKKQKPACTGSLENSLNYTNKKNARNLSYISVDSAATSSKTGMTLDNSSMNTETAFENDLIRSPSRRERLQHAVHLSSYYSPLLALLDTNK
ncbi:unnamed protein product [Gongylonema pulchrum]|uniref:PDZ domain-containing protein n=1 Tax=Gongylonema pulchrum TaxID=637853 RepID=A0A183D3Q9_9BILA|nr:unnamed protein product [Gongylonema pulchrum]